MVAYLEHLAATHVYPEGKNAFVYFEPRVAGRHAPQLSGWGPHCPRWPPGDFVEPVWGLPARLKPIEPQRPSRSLSGDRLGPPGPVRAHRAPDGLQEALWSVFGAFRPGSGP
jgi:hypothetical protein